MNNILVVDDEKLIRDSLKRLLEKNNYRVTLAESVEEALTLIPEQAFDLILSDLRLPGAPGTALIEQLPDIPIIMCTGFSEKINKDMAQRIGVKDFHLKPLGLRDIAESTRKVLDNNMH